MSSDPDIRLIRREILWTLSNIAGGTDDQCMKLFSKSKIINSLLESAENINERPIVKTEALYVISNILCKKIPVIRVFALGEETIKLILQIKNITDNQTSCKLLLGVLHQLLDFSDFPEIVIIKKIIF